MTDLTFECEKELKNLIGDEKRLRLIISTLVDNAIKFTQNGTVMIKASCDH